MKKLGLVGGTGPESTIPYYRGIVYGVQKVVGEEYFPNLTVESVNVFDILRLCGEENFDELTEYLLRAVQNLANSGAEFAALSANTPHIVFDRLEARSPIPLVSIVEAACEEAERRGFKKLGLLGTIFTMTGDFFKGPFVRRGIEIAVPTGEEMEYINGRIVTELEHGVVHDETLKGFQRVISRMQAEEHIEAVILGCTELPLILNDRVSPVPCLDTMEIHIQALVDHIVGGTQAG